MKKTDKLFKDEFVHFRWDDSLEGKMGFMEDGIGLLERKVADGVGNTIHKADSIGYPFKSDNSSGWRFAYYDPNYKFKRAWMDGKRVQYMTTIYVKNKWQDVPDEWYWDGNDRTQYRIAPEKVLKPFKDIAELKHVWEIKRGFTSLSAVMEHLIWVRSKANPVCTRLITGFIDDPDAEEQAVAIDTVWTHLDELFRQWEFLDGSPCGVLVSEEEEEEE